MSTLIDSAVPDAPPDMRFYGVAVAEVIGNTDETGLGRVQLRLPWLSGYQPWARVAVLSAGSNRGTYFIPQTGDEVLVAFNHGDVNEPFVVGSLWNGRDQTPRSGTMDPVNKRVIRTPNGHEIELDDAEQSITIVSSSGQKVLIDQQQIVMSAGSGAAKLTLTTAGEVTIEGTKIQIKATANAEVKAADLSLSADANATLKGSGLCTIQGGVVKIN
jgi:phage baseplate assembly protein V